MIRGGKSTLPEDSAACAVRWLPDAKFQKHPRIAKAYLRAGQKFLDTRPDSPAVSRYDNVYEWFTRDVFYANNKDWEKANGTLFGKPDYKKFLECQFGIDLTI